MKRLLKWLGISDRLDASPVSMSAEERNVILKFAAGALELRSKAIAIHRAHINTLGVRGDLYQCFMAEVDNPVPDYAQRNAYRQALLSGAS
jgi:hypothetical protein